MVRTVKFDSSTGDIQLRVILQDEGCRLEDGPRRHLETSGRGDPYFRVRFGTRDDMDAVDDELRTPAKTPTVIIVFER